MKGILKCLHYGIAIPALTGAMQKSEFSIEGSTMPFNPTSFGWLFHTLPWTLQRLPELKAAAQVVGHISSLEEPPRCKHPHACRKNGEKDANQMGAGCLDWGARAKFNSVPACKSGTQDGTRLEVWNTACGHWSALSHVWVRHCFVVMVNANDCEDLRDDSSTAHLVRCGLWLQSNPGVEKQSCKGNNHFKTKICKFVSV